MHIVRPAPTPHEIVANPAAFCRLPLLYGQAWEHLKRERGQSVDFARTGDPAHQIDTPLSVTLDEVRQRALVRIRIRARIARQRAEAAAEAPAPGTGGDAA